MLGVSELTALFDRFEQSVFRLENLDTYLTDHEAHSLARYLAGEPYQRPADMSWNEEMAEQVAAGRQWAKVHVLRDPSAAYFRYACEWSWPNSARYGQAVSILDLTGKPQPQEIPDEDFWVIDDTTVACMDYDGDGRFLRARLADPAEIPRYVRAKQLALQAAEPFDRWWARHPEHWRSSWLDRS